MTSEPTDPDVWMTFDWPTDRARHLLLPRGASYKRLSRGGRTVRDTAQGFGLIEIIGTSGSGKSTLATALMAWATMHSPVPRPLGYVGFPEKFLEVLPEQMRKVAYCIPSIEDLPGTALDGSIILIDDTGIHTPARAAMSKSNVVLSKFTQIARHLDITIIQTAQAFRIIDFAPSVVTEGCTLIKWFSRDSLAQERPERKWKIEVGNSRLERKLGHRRSSAWRPYYWCTQDRKIGKFPAPAWMLHDHISHPFKLLSMKERREAILG